MVVATAEVAADIEEAMDKVATEAVGMVGVALVAGVKEVALDHPKEGVMAHLEVSSRYICVKLGILTFAPGGYQQQQPNGQGYGNQQGGGGW